jgi:amino acid transporter
MGTQVLGVGIGKWTSDAGGIAIFLTGLVLVGAASLAWATAGSATRFEHLMPSLDMKKLNFWSQMTLAFTGLELGAIMAGEMRNPERDIPRAAWISGVVICGFYVCATMAILALVPAERVDLITGVVQAGAAAGTVLGTGAIPLAVALLYLVAVAGTIASYLGGAARLPFVMGLDQFLPPAFARLHPRWGTPWVAILGQALFGTAALLAATSGETLKNGYQLLIDLTAATTLFPFLYLFATAWKNGFRASAFSGLTVTALALALAFVPPEGTAWSYELKLAGGCAMVVLAARMNFQYALSLRQKQ